MKGKEGNNFIVRAAEKGLESPVSVALAVAMPLIMLTGAPAHAGGFTAISTSANTFMTWLKSICLVVMTICIIIVGWKKMNGASWGDVANVAIGGAIAGSATALAALFGTPD